jgi:CheY-like chemotaxis protein
MEYSFIFTDFSMPEMDGIESTEKIREFLTNEWRLHISKQPFIIGVTGHTEEKYRQRGIAAGMNEIQPKPLYYKAMMDLLKRYKFKP